MFSDIFRIKEFKNEIISLKAQVNRLNKDKQSMQITIDNLNSNISELNDKLSFKLSLKEQEADQLDETIRNKKEEFKEIQDNISTEKHKLEFLLNKIVEKEKELDDVKAEVGDLESETEISSYGLYDTKFEFSNSLQYKDKLKEIRDNEKRAVKEKTAMYFNPNWQLNGSIAKGRQMNNKNMKAMIRSFNNECTEAIRKVTYSNFNLIHKRIQKSFEQHNKINSLNDLRIRDEYLNYKFDELDLAFGYKLKKEQEKDKLREERQREREEQQNKREFEKNNKRIDKDIKHYEKAIDELKNRQLEQDNEELQSKIAELMSEIEAKKAERQKQEKQMYTPTAGYVYIISNIGTFGKNVFKIGVTRRLTPEDRVNELSSASVPFKYDIHALIYSDNAFELETKLHNRFDKNRVNRINNRKEFFNITIDDIKSELENYKDATVTFNEKPEADEYRATLKIKQKEEEAKTLNELLN